MSNFQNSNNSFNLNNSIDLEVRNKLASANGIFTYPDSVKQERQNNFQSIATKGKFELLPQSETTNPFTYAFLSLVQDSKDPIYIENPIGLCLVELLGANGEEIHVIQLSLLPLDKERIIEGIITINKVRPFKYVSMDLETMQMLNGDRSYTRTISDLQDEERKKGYINNYPALRIIQTPKNLSVYQQAVLNSPLRKGIITYLPELAENGLLMESIKQFGVSPLAYALAGAVDEALKAQKYLINN